LFLILSFFSLAFSFLSVDVSWFVSSLLLCRSACLLYPSCSDLCNVLSSFFIENMPLKGSAPVKPSLTTHETIGNTTHPDENDSGLSSSMMQNLEHSYDLYAVVNHLGGMFGGHYVAYAQCEDLLSPQGGLSASSSMSNNPSSSSISPQIYQKVSDLRSHLYDMSEVNLQDYANQNDTSSSSSLLSSSSSQLTSALSILQQQNINNVSIGSAMLANNTLETTHRWYKFDDDYAVELTSQHAPIETTIISGKFSSYACSFLSLTLFDLCFPFFDTALFCTCFHPFLLFSFFPFP
jgi:hypothetical protein